MKDLQKLPPTLDSREVAEMVGKTHAHLCRDIAGYIEIMSKNPKLDSSNFFIERAYKQAGNGKEVKRYDITKKGCEMVANKLTGEKGILFTAEYVERFNQMEKAIKTPRLTPNPHYRTRMIGTAIRDVGKTSEELEKVFGVAHGMALAVSMNLVGEAYGVDMAPCKALLPAAEEVSYLNATGIAERIGLKFKTGKPNAAAANQLLAERGLQEKRGKDWHLTERGKGYGEAKPYERGGHSGYQIMWRDEVIAALK